MAINNSISESKIWSPIKLWILALTVLAAGALSHVIGLPNNISVTLGLASYLLFSAGNPILNAIKVGLAKNLMMSLPLFILHAILTYLLLSWVNHEAAISLKRVFTTITIFYIMATTMSIFFRAIYKYISEH